MRSANSPSKISIESEPEVFVEIRPTLWYGENFHAALDAEAELIRIFSAELIRIFSEEIEKEIIRNLREQYEASLKNVDE